MKKHLVLALILGLCGLLPLAAQPRLIKVKEAWIGNGKVLSGAQILVGKDGKILAIGTAVDAPEGAVVHDHSDLIATPGLIEAESFVGMPGGQAANEQSKEVTPDYMVADVCDVADPGFAELARDGVTTVVVHAGLNNVIAGVPAAYKTGSAAGTARLMQRELGLDLTLGTSPARGNNSPRSGGPVTLYSRIPNNRMGVVVLIRQAFNAAAKGQGPKRIREALKGERKLFWRVGPIQEVISARAISKELGLPAGILLGAISPQREIEMLREWKASVFFGRFSHPRNLDSEFRFWAPQALVRAQIPFGFGRGSRALGAGLRDHALFAMRGGLSEQDALTALTLGPAKMLGIDERVGSLRAGKDADMVLWTGRGPMDPSSRVKVLYVDGRVNGTPSE